MIDDTHDQERYSICIASVSNGIERRFFKFYRIADYDPRSPMEIAPSLIEADARTPEERLANPNYLYNPQAVERYDDRDSDFYMFRWGWDFDDRNRPLTNAQGVETFLRYGHELREVIIPKGVHNEEDLRRALRKGIPFEGRTTRVFYLAYKNDGHDLLAARCDRDEFTFNDGLLSLPQRVTNVRGHSLNVPRVRLDSNEVIESVHADVRSRRVYGNLFEPEEDGKVLLRMLDDYADEYVRWFVKQEKVDGVTNAERQQAMRSVIEAAFDRPDALERYLEAGVPTEDVEALRCAISASASSQDDEARELIRDAILRDESFRNECVQKVMTESVDALKEKQAEVEAAQAKLREVEQEASEAQNRLAEAIDERDLVNEEVAKGRDKLKKLAGDRESMLNELESNLALRLGLKAVASSLPTTSEGAQLLVTAGIDVENTAEGETLWNALSKNMKKLGVSCLVGHPEESLNQSAVGVEAALAATHVLAIPTPVARPIADALAIALKGKTAKRVQVPSSHRPVGCLIDELPQAEEVTIFENVIDPVNEGALFAIIGSDCEGVVVLPFSSHASALLVAKEAWERMFFPCVESLCLLPSQRRSGSKMRRVHDSFRAKQLDGEQVLDTTRELIASLEDIGLPNSSYLLPGAVLTALDDMLDDELFDPLSVITQHMGFITGLEGDSYRLLREKSEGDIGLMELARRLGKDAR